MTVSTIILLEKIPKLLISPRREEKLHSLRCKDIRSIEIIIQILFIPCILEETKG